MPEAKPFLRVFGGNMEAETFVSLGTWLFARQGPEGVRVYTALVDASERG